METLNSMLYLLSYNSKVTTHALGVLSSYHIEKFDAVVLPHHLLWYARHEHCLTGESPEQALIAGIA